MTFSNAVCGLWLTNTYWYRARTYIAANTTSVWWSAAIGIAPKTNRVVELAVLSNSVLADWVRDTRWPVITLTNPPGPRGFWKLQAAETFF